MQTEGAPPGGESAVRGQSGVYAIGLLSAVLTVTRPTPRGYWGIAGTAGALRGGNHGRGLERRESGSESRIGTPTRSKTRFVLPERGRTRTSSTTAYPTRVMPISSPPLPAMKGGVPLFHGHEKRPGR